MQKTKLPKKLYGLTILGGLLLGFSYPPYGIITGFFAFFGLVPMLNALESSNRFRDAFKLLWVGMFFFGLAATWWVGGFYGIGEVDPFLMLGGVMLVVVHPFFLIIPLLLYDITRRRIGRTQALIALPLFYAGFEYLHSFGDLAFPWISLFNSQTYNTAFIQFISFTGPYALTMLIVAINILIFLLIKNWGAKKVCMQLGAALALVIAIPYTIGIVLLNEDEPIKKTLTVSIIQPNINPWAKWQSNQERVMDTNYMATARAFLAAHGATDLIIWPETAIPFPITISPERRSYLQFADFLDSLNRPLLTGFPDEEFYFGSTGLPEDAKPVNAAQNIYYRSWNAAMLTYRDRNGRHIDRYHKQILVPLGEHVPFIDALPFLGNIFKWSVGLGSWNVGTGYHLLTMPMPHRQFSNDTSNSTDSVRLSSLICYESIYPSFVRHFVDEGAEALIVITNDGWYGKSPGPYQHNQYAVLRAIENRRWTLRSANTGISSIIDEKGRFVEQTPLFEQTSLTYPIPLNDNKTFYTRYGDFIAIPCAWVAGLASIYFFVLWIIERRKRKGLIEPKA